MYWILYFVALLWLFFGALALISPRVLKKLIRKSESINWLWGIIILILAYLLWCSSDLVTQIWFVQLIAILAGIKGFLLLILPKKNVRQWLEHFLQRTSLFWRSWAVVVLFLAWYLFSIIY